MKFIKFFSKLNKDDVLIAGGKGASLGEMYSSKFPVPNGFVVLSSAFNKFLEESNLNNKIKLILKKVNVKNINTVEKASKEI